MDPTCTDVTACSVFPTIHGCSVSVFWWVYLSSIGAFGSITSASVSVSITAALFGCSLSTLAVWMEGFWESFDSDCWNSFSSTTT